MSLRAQVINLFLRLVEKRRLMRADDPADLRAGFERSARLFFHGPRGARYEAATLGGVGGLRVTGPGAGDAQVLLYFHGGGYVMGSPATHKAMLARLSKLTKRVAWLPDYRKAPEAPFPAAVEDALAVYEALCATGASERIVIGGDSAGGGLALALLGEICRLELPQPAGIFAFSPLTDMTFSGTSFAENARADAVLPVGRARDMEEMYMAGGDPTDPRASPLWAEFTGACPVWLCVGDSEILLDDTRRMAERLRAQGVKVRESVAHNLPHVWPLFQPVMPEANATLDDLAGWISSLSSSSGES
ncbi:alpha/beta hydrolase [Rhodobacteraceae bacterium D3-12]|nr:alpha/beta hydrolase [Rhodobacteraceae bacterium D3-12]